MSGLLARYQELLAAGELRADAEQAAAAERLAQLQKELEATVPASGFLSRLLRTKPSAAPRGVYLWGGVGRGKSMLMDLFHGTLALAEKRRVHFHAFMLEVHSLMRDVRRGETGDPIPQVAARIARSLRVLAFDEMVVNNSADAMIMSRLFTALIRDHGLVIVTTSNRAPAELYKDGLNREHFLPFIALIEASLDVLPLNGPVDYRLQRLGGLATWHTPLGDAATAQCREAFFRLTDYPPEDSAHVPSLAMAYHTVIVVGIPRLGPELRNETARFVTLIDALYENKVKLFAAAATVPEDLYDTGAKGNESGRFEFERTVSRLVEMQSLDYLALGHGEE